MSVRRSDIAKRGIDVTASAVALLLSAPLQIAVGVAVRVRMGAPVLFRQERPGREGRLFTLVKFRTMKPVENSTDLSSDDVRMTPLGQALRRTSLDELPTLWNVLKGDMSLVGPRPLLPEYLALYTPEQSRRHEVRPGVTGLAQVNGRNTVDWERRLALDVEYVERRSTRLDLQILVQTLSVVFRAKGTSAPGHVTMPRFEGTPKVAR